VIIVSSQHAYAAAGGESDSGGKQPEPGKRPAVAAGEQSILVPPVLGEKEATQSVPLPATGCVPGQETIVLPCNPLAVKHGPYIDIIRRVIDSDTPCPCGQAHGKKQADAEASAKAEIIESAAMLEACLWLDEYFSVQVDYTKEEVTKFRAKVAAMSSGELRCFLGMFGRERGLLLEQRESSEYLRADSLALNQMALWKRHAEKKLASKVYRTDPKRTYIHEKGYATRGRNRKPYPNWASWLGLGYGLYGQSRHSTVVSASAQATSMATAIAPAPRPPAPSHGGHGRR